MASVRHLLPTLAVHRGLVSELLVADNACCALGLPGLIALRPDEPVPTRVSASGFDLGYCVLATESFEVVQLTFQFIGFKTYNVLINPSSTVVQRTLAPMLQSGEYFVFFFDTNRSLQTF